MVHTVTISHKFRETAISSSIDVVGNVYVGSLKNYLFEYEYNYTIDNGIINIDFVSPDKHIGREFTQYGNLLGVHDILRVLNGEDWSLFN